LFSVTSLISEPVLDVIHEEMKKVLRETQTLCAGYTNAEPKSQTATDAFLGHRTAKI